MKPTSIIFLILSVILILTGLITCGIASGMAKSQDIEIYEQSTDDNGNTIKQIDIEKYNIKSISLNLKNADVTIYGNSNKSYIEIVNFNINSYTYSSSGGSFSFNDGMDIVSFFNFNGEGGGFKGLRYFLNKSSFSSKPHKINIFLSNDCQVSSIYLSIKEGNYREENVNLSIAHEVNVETGSVIFKNCDFDSKTKINCVSGDLTLDKSYVGEIKASISNGNFKNNAINNDMYSYSIKVSSGSVYVDGENRGKAYSVISASQLTLADIEIENGDAIISAD